MDHRQAYSELLRRVREGALVESCASLLGWDERTYMPHHGSAHRAEQMALLARLSHEMLTAPIVGELEQALISGDLKPADVPGAWNEKFKRFFNLTPPTDAQGCLQDIHWSMGGIGYFPTYTLGNLYAAQFMEQARRDVPGIDGEFRAGRFQGLKTWLNGKIHRAGQRYRAGELCQRVTSRPLSHQPLMAYLRGKYGPLYGI